MENDFPYCQQSSSHCRKCGRRSRKHHANTWGTTDRSHSHRWKCERHQRLFPTEYPPHSSITQTNDNHSRSKSILNRNSSRKSSERNVIIDQFIQVQQLSATNCETNRHNHTLPMNTERQSRQLVDTVNLGRSKRVQQMIYLRENINNSTYREIQFANEYIILKRLEEKNHLINQNRFQVDHYCRPLKLQYQTISILCQNIPITSFTYSKQNPSTINTSVKRCPLDENYSALPTDRSVPTTVEMNDTKTNESSMNTDSPILITTYQESKPQNYSGNAIQSFPHVDQFTKTKKQNLSFDTAVIVDLRKCPQIITPIQLHGNHIESIWSTSLPKDKQSISFPWSQNSNHMPLQQIFEVPYETTCSPLTVIRNNPLPNNSSAIHQDSTINNSGPLTIPLIDANSKTNNRSIKYTETLNKLKQLLDILQRHFLKKSLPSPFQSTQIDQSIYTAMTSDSLSSTYSVSSTVPILQKNSARLPYNQSTINVENEISQIEVDSLNKNYYSDRIKLRNSARNINCNQQLSDDNETENSTQSQPRRISRHTPIQSMPPSFMLVLQLLFLLCLMNRISTYHVFGTVPIDLFVSTSVENSPYVTPISPVLNKKTEKRAVSENDEGFLNFFSSFLKLI